MSFETREIDDTELMTLIKLEGTEGWLVYSTNEDDIEVPEEPAVLEGKSDSERLRAVFYVYYQKLLKENKYIGLFETFKKEQMNKIIEHIKSKLD